MSSPARSHFDIRPGWEYLTLALDDDSVLGDEHLEVFERFVAGVLNGHRHHLYRGERWVMVAVAPPAAAETMVRLNEAFADQMGAFDEPWPDDCAN